MYLTPCCLTQTILRDDSDWRKYFLPAINPTTLCSLLTPSISLQVSLRYFFSLLYYLFYFFFPFLTWLWKSPLKLHTSATRRCPCLQPKASTKQCHVANCFQSGPRLRKASHLAMKIQGSQLLCHTGISAAERDVTFPRWQSESVAQLQTQIVIGS